ncbi:MAG: lamin tail domain-containing protein, partial [Solirubrobacterales bacterium]
MMKGLYWVSALLVAAWVGISDVRAEQVVFSEIMYHPSEGLPEYIEVYNHTATPFDIADWRLTGGVDYAFPAFSAGAVDRTFFQPFERILLSSVDETTLRAAYSIPSTVRVYGPWTGSLKNGGERVSLKD